MAEVKLDGVKEVSLGKNKRYTFSKIDDSILEMPNLIEIQKSSYRWFREKGMQEVLRDMSGITDHSETLVLDFVGYRFDDTPKYSIVECKARDATYAVPLRVTATLLNKSTGEIKESEVFMGEFPLMTDAGTFVINGAERTIVSQLVRSPGVYYDVDIDAKTGKKLFKTTVIPNRGAWLEYETDANDVLYVRIDKNRKVALSTFVRSLGYGKDSEIRDVLGADERMDVTMDKDLAHNVEEGLMEIYKKLRPGEPFTVDNAQSYIESLFFDERRYDMSRVGRYKYNKKLSVGARAIGFVLSRPAVNAITGEIVADAGVTVVKKNAGENQINAADLDAGAVREVFVYAEAEQGQTERKILSNCMVDITPYLSGLTQEAITAEELDDIGINEWVRIDVLSEMLSALEECSKLELLAALAARRTDLIPNHLTVEDILASVNYLQGLPWGIGVIDDIDHLGNRRIRQVGELLQNQMRIGFSRMDRVIRDKMTLQAQDMDAITPQSLINIRPVVAAVKEFFGSSPLSQFMDQNNPLAELTHKRRLSALGPGGLSRDRAGFEVRDVHYTHYGRMCPIETPEGPNIGLISYLATYARINQYGFVEAPFRRVVHTEDGETIVTKDVVYMTADVEDEYIVAQANTPLDDEGHFTRKKITARHRDEFVEIAPEFIDFMDVSPKMVVSVATAMIPFLENDDANRALMGANMQRQAVPLLRTESPVVGTGMEYKAAVDSGVVVLSDVSGEVIHVEADHVDVREDGTGNIRTFEIIKFLRSNQGTCTNQRPIVEVGQHVVPGDVIADGPATSNGEISLGKNVLIGYMTFEGYNYEDAVLINEKVVRDDVFTSIHIEEYELEARDTKLGPEEITRDIPNVGEDALKDLDEHGIIRVGAEVTAGDILVGKVTPKGETELTAEERLLRAIFGEKAREVRDTSLRVPHGEYGTVVDVKVFNRQNSSELNPGVNVVVRCYIAQKRKISVGDKMAGRHGNKGVVSRIMPVEDMPFLPDGTPLDIVLNPLGVPSRMNIGQVLEVHLGYAAKLLGIKICTPVFDGAHEEDIRKMLVQAGVAEDGKTVLYDGRTGRPFDNRVTVGYKYFLKLHHLVDDKIHARSIGPYSLVTQQPLGGKAQFGGQRFGEMEVWALEAYGATYTLQEILTVKSDDVEGRVKTYESIVKGQNVPKPGVPESFKVLVKELQSLGLDVRVLDKDDAEIDLRQHFEDDDIGLPPAPADYEPELVNDGFDDGYSMQDENGDPLEEANDTDYFEPDMGADEE